MYCDADNKTREVLHGARCKLFAGPTWSLSEGEDLAVKFGLHGETSKHTLWHGTVATLKRYTTPVSSIWFLMRRAPNIRSDARPQAGCGFWRGLHHPVGEFGVFQPGKCFLNWNLTLRNDRRSRWLTRCYRTWSFKIALMRCYRLTVWLLKNNKFQLLTTDWPFGI